jgi:hypothetical protein
LFSAEVAGGADADQEAVRYVDPPPVVLEGINEGNVELRERA